MTHYRTIVADPPWDYPEFVSYPGTRVDRNKNGKQGGQRRVTKPLPYEAMSVDEICALPVREMADRSSALWLWATSRYLPSAFEVMAAWGFRYKQTLVWHKHTAAPARSSCLLESAASPRSNAWPRRCFKPPATAEAHPNIRASQRRFSTTSRPLAPHPALNSSPAAQGSVGTTGATNRLAPPNYRRRPHDPPTQHQEPQSRCARKGKVKRMGEITLGRLKWLENAASRAIAGLERISELEPCDDGSEDCCSGCVARLALQQIEPPEPASRTPQNNNQGGTEQ